MHVRVRDCMGKQTVLNYNCVSSLSVERCYELQLTIDQKLTTLPDRKSDNTHNYVKNQIQFNDCMASSQEEVFIHLNVTIDCFQIFVFNRVISIRQLYLSCSPQKYYSISPTHELARTLLLILMTRSII